MTMTHMQYIRPGDELILKGTPDITYVWNQPPYSRFVWNGSALEALGTGSGGGYIPLQTAQISASALIKTGQSKVISIFCVSASGGKVTLRDGVTVGGALVTNYGGGGASGLALTAGQLYVATGAPTDFPNGIYIEISGTGTYTVQYA